jgi:hypothetical protein
MSTERTLIVAPAILRLFTFKDENQILEDFGLSTSKEMREGLYKHIVSQILEVSGDSENIKLFESTHPQDIKLANEYIINALPFAINALRVEFGIKDEEVFSA